MANKNFHFGLEAEFIVRRASTGRPLHHSDLNFSFLNTVLESIPVDDLPALSGLELEPPHKILMPYVVEGYHVHNERGEKTDLLPKGLEIRTPVCTSLAQMLSVFIELYRRLEIAVSAVDLSLMSLSHHPVESRFVGPQCGRRYDFWQWAMEVMTTYGPDVNVSLPDELWAYLDLNDLHGKLNYYGPALAALTVGSPVLEEKPWQIRGVYGQSFRMYKRSYIAPAIEIHPHEGNRLEFKLFDMPRTLPEVELQFLLFLGLLLNPELKGRASHQTRIYDLGQVAIHGLDLDFVKTRLGEFLERTPAVLESWGFKSDVWSSVARQLATGETPALAMLRRFDSMSLNDFYDSCTPMFKPSLGLAVAKDPNANSTADSTARAPTFG